MNQPHPFLKAAVVASSLLLVSVFVLYKAGALNGIFAPGDAPSNVPRGDASSGVAVGRGAEPLAVVGRSMPDTPDAKKPGTAGKMKSDSAQNARRGAARDTARANRAYFGGSKSGVHLIDLNDTAGGHSVDTVATEHRDTTPRRERFMGGSKSLAPLIDPPAPKGKERRISDSSRTTMPR